MELITRPQFYLDVAEEVEYLAERAGPETAERWHSAVGQTIIQLLRHALYLEAKDWPEAIRDTFLARK